MLMIGITFASQRSFRSQEIGRIRMDELATDKFSLKKLSAAGYNLCLLSMAIEKVDIEPFHMREQPGFWMNGIVLERFSIAQEACAKQKPDHVVFCRQKAVISFKSNLLNRAVSLENWQSSCICVTDPVPIHS